MGVDALGSLNLLAQEYDLTHQLIVPFAQTSVVLVQPLLLLLQLYRIPRDGALRAVILLYNL